MRYSELWIKIQEKLIWFRRVLVYRDIEFFFRYCKYSLFIIVVFVGIVSGDKRIPFRCSKCGKSYKHQASLYNHVTFACGKEPSFRCEFCCYRGNYKYLLKLHLFKVHNITVWFNFVYQLDCYGLTLLLAGIFVCVVLYFHNCTWWWNLKKFCLLIFYGTMFFIQSNTFSCFYEIYIKCRYWGCKISTHNECGEVAIGY